MPSRILTISLRLFGALLAVIIGLYPILYYINNNRFGLRDSKREALLHNCLWNAGFYTHITASGIALLIGWLQFNNRLLIHQPAIHRNIGKAYLVTAVAGAAAGIAISIKATGGAIPALGFFCLGITWLGTTVQGYRVIRQGRVEGHRTLMMYSYACCFAAVTLRLWLAGLGFWLPFSVAYPIVAWLSWLPNLLVAWLIIVRTKPGSGHIA